MKNLFKFFLVLSVLFCVGFFCFAEETYDETVQKLGITDSDIKAFVKNNEAISKALEEYEETNYSEDSDIEVYNEIEDILGKYGISGPYRTLKVSNMVLGTAYEISKKELENELDKESLALMKSMGMDPYQTIDALKASIHPDDMKVISRNRDLLLSLNMNEDESVSKNTDDKPKKEKKIEDEKFQLKEKLKEKTKEKGSKMLKNMLDF